MMEDKDKKIKTLNNSSVIQDKKALTDEELLEQILNKKKNKKNYSKKNSNPNIKKVSKKKEIVKKNKNLSDDELLEQILAKKRKNKNNKKIVKNNISNDEVTFSLEDKDLNLNSDSANKDKIKNDDAVSNYNSLNEDSISKLDNKLDISKNQDTNNILDDNNDIDLCDKNIKSNEQKDRPVEPLPEQQLNTEEDKKDLIITRSITFDNEINLKDKKTLKELRKAIEEFDRIETLSEISSSSEKINAKQKNNSDDKEETPDNQDLFKTSMITLGKRSERYSDLDQNTESKEKKDITKTNYDLDISLNSKAGDVVSLDCFEKKNLLALLVCIFLIMLLGVILLFYFTSKKEDKKELSEPQAIDFTEQVNENDFLETDYQNCLSAVVDENDFTEEMNKKIEELNAYLKNNYNASVMYEDLNLGYSYQYNSNEVYYAASTIKSLVALYIYREADAERLNLDDKLTYTKKYAFPASKGMSKHKYGDKVSLRELVKYAVIYSDNSAHQMLVNYIGRNKLKDYGLFLGAKHTLSGGDNFGNIDVNDAIIYMKAIHNFINKGSSLSLELKSYFVSAEQNDLALPDLNIEAAHKYGSYGKYYHDIGIVYDKNPYVVAILTTDGSGDYESKVKNIHRQVYMLHQSFYENREKICKAKFYGN